jgi:hypothetical protein
MIYMSAGQGPQKAVMDSPFPQNGPPGPPDFGSNCYVIKVSLETGETKVLGATEPGLSKSVIGLALDCPWTAVGVFGLGVSFTLPNCIIWPDSPKFQSGTLFMKRR